MFIFKRERERESMSKGGAERESKTENLKQALCCESAEPDAGLELINLEIVT